jgi:hypothetical protein
MASFQQMQTQQWGFAIHLINPKALHHPDSQRKPHTGGIFVTLFHNLELFHQRMGDIHFYLQATHEQVAGWV